MGDAPLGPSGSAMVPAGTSSAGTSSAGTLPAGTSAGSPAGSGVLVVLALTQFVMTVDTTVMNVSITAVVRDLDTTVSDMQLAITLFTLVMAASMITGGRIGDMIGSARALKIGLVIYAIGSAITAISPSIGALIFGWSFLEGLGAALVMPAVAAQISTTVPLQRRPAAYGTIAAAAAAAVGLGPVIGGWVTTTYTWRYVFVAEVVICIGILVVAGRFLGPPVEPAAEPPGLDPIGAVLSALGLGAIVFGIVRSSEWGVIAPKSPPTIGSVTIAPLGISPTVWLVFGGLLVLWGFMVVEGRRVAAGRDVLVPPTTFENRPLTSGLLVLLAQNSVQSGVFFALPLFLSIVLGLSPLDTGIALVPLSLSLIVGAMGTPRLAAGVSPRLLVRVGLLVVVAGVVALLASITVEATARSLALPLLILGLGVGILASQVGNIIISSVPSEESGLAGGLQYTASNLGASLGTAVVGVVLLLGLAGSAGKGIASIDSLATEEKAAISVAISSNAQFVSDDQLAVAIDRTPALAEEKQELLEVNRQARLAALRSAMVGVALGAIAALFATGHIPRWLGDGATEIGPDSSSVIADSADLPDEVNGLGVPEHVDESEGTHHEH